ncbi:S-adenosyl-L-methionine-dependent methyl transferase [Mycobacterium tuberculosis]|nr:S-adenosyl-L-methionine-dependent methyl transferase [Mycobacterium tuberculosis]
MFFDGDRNDIVEYLTGLGWQVSTRPRRELFADYGLVFPEDDTSQLRNIVSLTATR